MIVISTDTFTDELKHTIKESEQIVYHKIYQFVEKKMSTELNIIEILKDLFLLGQSLYFIN